MVKKRDEKKVWTGNQMREVDEAEEEEEEEGKLGSTGVGGFFSLIF